jgi:outer membrane receptor for ferrienterochelin and colicin
MEKEAGISPEFYNVGFRYDKLKLRGIHDAYEYDYKDRYGSFYGRRRAIFNATGISGEYEFVLSDRHIITPKIIFTRHNPWRYETPVFGTEKNIVGERLTYKLLGKYKIDEESLLTYGAEYYKDRAFARPSYANKGGSTPKYDKEIYFDGDDEVSYYNRALFAQYEFTTPIGDIVLGGRYEDHTYAGTDFVSRLAITKVYDKFHYKLLAAEAFRTPNIENINYANRAGITIQPEKTTTYEGEIGYKFSDTVLWTANAFHLTIDDPLYYNAADKSYINANRVASYGIESELRYIPSWGDVKIRYAWYNTDVAGVPLWITDDKNQAAAFPNHQLSFDVTYNLTNNSSINVNGFITTDYERYKTSDGLPTEHYDSPLILNVYYLKRLDNMTIGLGISDLFDEREEISSYNSFQAPVPQMGRTFYLTCAFKF